MSERAAIPFGVGRPGWIDEFKAFIMRGNVVDLAVGIIIGVAFTAVVNSLVKDVFTPLIGLLVGGIDFTNIFVTLKGASEATLAEAQKAGAVTLNIGVFVNAVIQFLIVSLAVFWLIKALTRLRVREGAGGCRAPTQRGAAPGDPRPPRGPLGTLSPGSPLTGLGPAIPALIHRPRQPLPPSPLERYCRARGLTSRARLVRDAPAG